MGQRNRPRLFQQLIICHRLPNNLNTHGIIPYGPPADYVPGPTLSAPEHQNPTLVKPVSSTDSSQTPDQYSIPFSKPADRRASLAVQINTGPVKLGIPSTAPPHPLPPRPKSGTSPPTSPGASGNNSTTSQGHANGRVSVSNTGRTSNPSASLPNDSMSGLKAQLPNIPRTSLPSKPVQPTSYSMKDAPTHRYSGNLDEIETLRRQELQARKAVLASRKPKLGVNNNINKPYSTPSPSSLSGQGSRKPSSTPVTKSPPRRPSTSSDQKALVPVEAVDDFLKSITSDSTTDRISGETTLGPVTHSPEPVDMDTDSNVRDGPIFDGSRAFLLNPTSSSTSMDSQSTSGQQRPLLSKKASRPVAADFVDYDTTPHEGPSTAVAPNGDSNGRLISTPSFASLASTRKIVIDFSDTEDELDEDAVIIQLEDGSSSHTRSIPTSSSTHTNASNAPTPEPVPPMPLTAVTPEALILKEKEIRRMKEMIAERERLKKLASQVRCMMPCLIFDSIHGIFQSQKVSHYHHAVLP